jgi:leucyl aminopeptidase (aminopeptidase T)
MTFGPKLVALDSKARIRYIVKRLARELAKPGTTNLTFVIEREGAWNVQGTHRDPSDTANALERAVGSLRRI